MDSRILLQANQKFIRDHEQSDIYDLSLKGSSSLDIDLHLLLNQIRSRQIAARKAAIFYNKEGIYYPPPVSMEQCSSDSTARYKQSILKGNHLVDLTGGSGIDTLYLGESFEKVTYVEQSEELCSIFQYNSDRLSRQNITVVNKDAISYLDSINKVDAIYIDPSRRNENNKVFLLQESEPDVLSIWSTLCSKTDHLLVKASPMLSIPEVLQEIQEPLSIHFISVKNELKEILLHRSPEISTSEYHCVNLETDDPTCHWTPEAESEARVTLKKPMSYIYEPNASIMKAGGYRWISVEYNLNKLHRNTHLYTSEELIDFPGRRFAYLGNLSSKDLKKIRKANVAVRNHPLTPEQIKKKYKISDGGEEYLYGCTLMDQSKAFLHLRRIH